MNKKPYKQDINDLVEEREDMNKGGVGSGQKGHTTTHAKTVETARKLADAQSFHAKHKSPDSRANLRAATNLHRQAVDAHRKFLGPQSLQMKKGPIYKAEKLYEGDINDMIADEIEKGGVGSGIKGHQTHHSDDQVSKVRADSKKVAEAIGRPADVFRGKDGLVISGAVDARHWDEKGLRARLPKDIHDNYDIKIESKIANGRKALHINLKPKVKSDGGGSVNQIKEMMAEADSYIEKFKMKHPEGMNRAEQKTWFEGAGLNPSQVQYCMEKVIPKRLK